MRRPSGSASTMRLSADPRGTKAAKYDAYPWRLWTALTAATVVAAIMCGIAFEPCHSAETVHITYANWTYADALCVHVFVDDSEIVPPFCPTGYTAKQARDVGFMLSMTYINEAVSVRRVNGTLHSYACDDALQMAATQALAALAVLSVCAVVLVWAFHPRNASPDTVLELMRAVEAAQMMGVSSGTLFVYAPANLDNAAAWFAECRERRPDVLFSSRAFGDSYDVYGYSLVWNTRESLEKLCITVDRAPPLEVTTV
jgi:hypothetical protein